MGKETNLEALHGDEQSLPEEDTRPKVLSGRAVAAERKAKKRSGRRSSRHAARDELYLAKRGLWQEESDY